MTLCPVGREKVGELLRRNHGEHPALDATYFERKAAAQHRLVATGEDLRVLKGAMVAFRSLQHVQILRLQDEADRHLMGFLNDADPPEPQDPGLVEQPAQPLVDLKWTPACTRATQTIGQALVSARSPFSRFSGPMMSAQSALVLSGSSALPGAVPALAERLTCLELHLEDGAVLGERLLELSGLFKQVFSAAKHMQAVHIGFPTHRPIGIPLERIFNEVRWEKLRAVGVQSWRLEADEIIALARRHRKTLRGLRLRDVLLRDGSRWADVLGMLREEMELLEWVSLRRIDYSDHFDEMWAGSMEVPEYPAGNGSDSDDEDGFHAHVDSDGDEHDHDSDELHEYDEHDEHDDGDWDGDSIGVISNADTDHGPDANALPLSPDTPPSSLPYCTCSHSSYPASADDLGDNGRSVLYQQRKFWEKWVIGRCPEHSDAQPS